VTPRRQNSLMCRCRNEPEIRMSRLLSFAGPRQVWHDPTNQLGGQSMRNITSSVFAVFAVAAVAFAAAPAEAKSRFKKAAEGVALTENLAKFQVDAALLQATDWSIYFTWVGGAGTPGYTFGPRAYKCSPGDAIGWQCEGSATLCKL
jgi:hypothetical protein